MEVSSANFMSLLRRCELKINFFRRIPQKTLRRFGSLYWIRLNACNEAIRQPRPKSFVCPLKRPHNYKTIRPSHLYSHETGRTYSKRFSKFLIVLDEDILINFDTVPETVSNSQLADAGD
jgi:hypothetical protein